MTSPRVRRKSGDSDRHVYSVSLLVRRVLGVVLVMLVARMWAFDIGYTLLGKRNGASVGETGGGAQAHKRSAPLSSCSPACLPACSWLFTCGVVGWLCGWRLLRR